MSELNLKVDNTIMLPSRFQIADKIKFMLGPNSIEGVIIAVLTLLLQK